MTVEYALWDFVLWCNQGSYRIYFQKNFLYSLSNSFYDACKSNKPPCLSEPGIQGQIMGDYIHLFNGLKKAIQMRDEDEENEDDDDEEIEDEEEELNVSEIVV